MDKFKEITPAIEQVVCFKCPKCEFVSLSKEKVSEHLSQDHKPSIVPFVSDVTETSTSSFEDYSQINCHLNVEAQQTQTGVDGSTPQSTKKKFPCSITNCSVRFTSESNINYHIKCHFEGSSVFKCPECAEIKKTWQSMAMHLWKNHMVNLELLSCTLCDYRTGNKELMKYHVKTHSDQRTCLCDECGKGFKNMKQLRNHKELHSLQKQSTEQELKCKCIECGKILSSARMLRAHRNAVHLKVRNHLCNYCGYSTTSQSNLRIHLRQHTKEKPFSCDDCDYHTADHNSLRRHRMKHTGEKRYKCPHCSYASIQSSSYKIHLRNKHPGLSEELIFGCSLCAFRTIRKDQLDLHSVVMHEDAIKMQ